MIKKRRRFYHHILDEGLINLTPLIDVVFVVLVTFILVAPLLEIEQVDLSPSTVITDKNLSNKTRICIYVREDNSIWVNKRNISLMDLTDYLKEMKGKFPMHIPQLYHDKAATFGTYQSVKGCMEKAGFSQMDVILKSSE